MATEGGQALRAFKSFIDEQRAADEIPTVNEVIARWDYENETAQEGRQTLESIRQGLADVATARVMRAREAIAELRRKHNVPDL